MLRTPARLAVQAALLLVCACGARDPVKAATPDVQGLLAALQAGDARGFEAHLDRPALRADLRRQVAGVGHANGLDVEGGPSDLALDRRIDPAALRLVRQGTDQPLAAAPSPGQTAALLKAVDHDHVCLRDPAQRCLLMFARETAGWRLTAMPAQPGVRIEIGPEK